MIAFWPRANLTRTKTVAMVGACTTRIDQHGQTAPTQELVHYVIVRADLPIGSQVAQSVHAAGESASPRPVPGTIAVALHARAEDHLRDIANRLVAAGLAHHRVFESADDPKYPNELMAIGLQPIPVTERHRVKKVLSDLPLVKTRPCSHGCDRGCES